MCNFLDAVLTKISIKNFMSIKEATIYLQPLTVFIGANNSGKSNFFRALECILEKSSGSDDYRAGLVYNFDPQLTIQLKADFFSRQGVPQYSILRNISAGASKDNIQQEESFCPVSVECFNLNIEKIINPCLITANAKVESNGGNVTAVLDWLRGEQPQLFAIIEQELQRLVPDVERIILKTVLDGQKQLGIQQKGCKQPIIGAEVSQGVLMLIVLLTIIYQPNPPTIICLECPEKHIHPRLLRSIVGYLTGLAYHGTNPTQVLMSSHSPYILDIFKTRLEEVIIVEKEDYQTRFISLSDYEKVIGQQDDLSLGELWFSGLLGGIPKENVH